jgi:hypothetical protein
MTTKRFTPERGQFFWFIREVEINKFPDLEIKSAKFDPNNKEHKLSVKNSTCFLTESDAFESLVD